MKRWLPYKIIAVVCGLLVSSCTTNDDGLDINDSRVPVHLTLSFSGSATSRDVTSSDATLDYTTEAQSSINDVYVLVVDAKTNKLKYLIEDLDVDDIKDDYNTKSLTGTMLRTIGDEQIRLVVLANLSQNQISNVSGDDMKAFLKNKINLDISDIYNALVYNYDGTVTPWTIGKGNGNRCIPMWGQTIATSVPSQGVELSCNLYRAVAKVNIWVNMKQGISGSSGDFTITKITVNNTRTQGYCVSQQIPNNAASVQYTSPSVPITGNSFQSVVYSGLNQTKEYVDIIYLPEQDNTSLDASPVTLTVEYSYNGKSASGILEFIDENTKSAFDVIRNHSYIFNINKAEEISGKLYYTVDEWVEKTIDIPTFE